MRPRPGSRTSSPTTAVDGWITDKPLILFSIDIKPDEIEFVVVGSDQPGAVDELGASIETKLGRDVTTTVRWVFEERFETDGES